MARVCPYCGSRNTVIFDLVDWIDEHPVYAYACSDCEEEFTST